VCTERGAESDGERLLLNGRQRVRVWDAHVDPIYEQRGDYLSEGRILLLFITATNSHRDELRLAREQVAHF
jgi:hypothetical protein